MYKHAAVADRHHEVVDEHAASHALARTGVERSLSGEPLLELRRKRLLRNRLDPGRNPVGVVIAVVEQAHVVHRAQALKAIRHTHMEYLERALHRSPVHVRERKQLWFSIVVEGLVLLGRKRVSAQGKHIALR